MKAVDLFAGLGGFTEGAEAAGVRVVWAANHWQVAVDYHRLNHPNVEHKCQDLHQADWSAVPRHDLLLASPACQGHSLAHGKEKPHHDATRSTAWAVVSCAEVHCPAVILVENVVRFTKWKLYPAWCAALHALGYALSPHVLDAADYGVPQNRIRLIVVATRSKHPFILKPRQSDPQAIGAHIEWDRGPWRTIDRSLAPRTLQRIANGRRSFGERFVAPYYKSGSGLTGRTIDRPIGTITTRDRWSVIDGNRMRMLNVNESRAAMGFRESYQLPENLKLAKHMLGNAIAPPMVTDIVRQIAA